MSTLKLSVRRRSRKNSNQQWIFFGAGCHLQLRHVEIGSSAGLHQRSCWRPASRAPVQESSLNKDDLGVAALVKSNICSRSMRGCSARWVFHTSPRRPCSWGRSRPRAAAFCWAGRPAPRSSGRSRAALGSWRSPGPCCPRRPSRETTEL